MNRSNACSACAWLLACQILVQRRLHLCVQRFRQLVQDVHRLMYPAALRASGGEDLGQGRPKAHRPVAYRKLWRNLNATVTHTQQQRLPALGGLPKTLFNGQKMLVAMGIAAAQH